MPKRLTREEFIEKSKKIHGEKYDYSKVEYINNKTKVCLICLIHGEFFQRPVDHLHNNGCPKCCKKNSRYTIEEFIEKANEIHNSKYVYSKVEYKDIKEKICIICPKHGEFWQIPNNHLNGNGCPKCSNIFPKSKMSQHILKLLKEACLTVEEEKTFDWLKNKRSLYLDFYLPQYNVAIEVQGEQHFLPLIKFGGEKGLNERRTCDTIKFNLCQEHGIKLFYVTKQNHNIDEILSYLNETATKAECT